MKILKNHRARSMAKCFIIYMLFLFFCATSFGQQLERDRVSVAINAELNLGEAYRFKDSNKGLSTHGFMVKNLDGYEINVSVENAWKINTYKQGRLVICDDVCGNSNK